MPMQRHIAVLCLLSSIYFIFSAGGLAYLYFYYGQQIYLLEKELSKHTSDLTTSEGKVLTNVYDIETEGRREDDDIGDESSSEISSYHDYKDETSLPFYCCIGNETNLKQVGYLLSISAI